MDLRDWIVLAIVSWPVYYLVFKLFFDSWDDFKECIYFWFKPDLLSLFHGEYWKDWWSELKLSMYFISCIFCLYCEGKLIQKYML
jgi:hypothetical protein